MSPKVPEDQKGRVNKLIQQFEEKAEGAPAGPTNKPKAPEIQKGHVADARAKLEAKGLFGGDKVDRAPKKAIADPSKNEVVETAITALAPPKGTTQPLPTAPLPPAPQNDIPQQPAPPADIPKGTKFGKKKVVNAPLGENQTGDVKISHIRSEEGNEYVVSNTQARGGFGKFRYALDMQGQRWAVKEFRSNEAPSKANPKTYVTNIDAIKTEIATMQAVGASLTVKDVMNIDGKVYAVMPIMSGEVNDIAYHVAPKDKQCVARSVLRQMAEDLGECHRRGYVHRDVKLRNALWNPDGKVSVADFGLTTKVGVEERLRGQAGTPGYMGPEMYNGQGHDTKVDTWSLALSAAEIHIPWNESPFTSANWGEWGNLRDGQETRFFNEFDQWRKALVTPEGLDTGLIKKDQSTPWDTYFSRLREADPVLCEYMLSHMLVNDPAKRASMDEVKAFMDKVQNQMSPGETQAKLAFNQLGGDTRKKDAIFKLLEKDRLTFSPAKSPIRQALTKARRWVRRLKLPWPR